MKPVVELKNQGTYKEGRHGNRATAEAPAGIPEPPKHLTRIEAKIFREIAKKMTDNSSISTLDVYTLEQYSVQLALFRKAKKELEVSDEYVITHINKAGAENQIPSPWLTVLKNTSDALLKLTAKLGLSPMDRNKVSKTETPVSEYWWKDLK